MSFSLRNARYTYNRNSEAKQDERIHGVVVDKLDINPTGVTAIIGHSGSGKTTLLSILAGFLAPQIDEKGHFLFEGQDITETGVAPGNVSFVFQNPMLLGSGSGLLNIFQGHVSRMQDPSNPPFGLTRLRQALEKLDLQDGSDSLAGKKAIEMSGGQAQRIAIMRALSMNPRAILCDEPTSSLDERTAKYAMEALHAWAGETGRPVLWVTHNLEHAARFADHFVFIAEGRVVELTEEQRDRLVAIELKYEEDEIEGMAPFGADAATERLAVLRDISDEIKPPTRQSEATALAIADGDPVIAPGRWRFAAWIANALSYDGWIAQRIDRGDHPRLAPRSLLRTLGQVTGRPVRENGLRSALLRVLCYSRYSFVFVLCVLLAQVAAVEGFGRLAQAYSESKLQDPSVARIVFEYIVPRDPDADDAPKKLYGDSTIGAMRDQIKKSLTTRFGPEADTDRVAVYGRRSISGSNIRFSKPGDACNQWISVQTVALNASDPLVRQVTLAKISGAAGLTESPDEVIEEARDNATNFDNPHSVALLDQFYLDRFIERCGHPPDSSIIVEWAVGQGGRAAPIDLQIQGAIALAPPLYPSQADMIVFEHDFQRAAGSQTGFVPPPYRIATAYFPIDGFQVARDVIKGGHYRVRDDSAAAVETLQNISQLAHRVPPVVVWTSLVGCAVLVLLVIIGILELNKRVFALFIAHGANFTDIFWAIFRHLVPAFVFAVVFVAGYGSLAVYFLTPPLPSGLGSIWDYAGSGFAKSVVTLGFATVLITVAVIVIWWRRTRNQLKNYLQE